MKRGYLLGAALFMSCMLTGCSSFSPEVTGVSISKKGEVTEVVREKFDKEYYDKKELEQQIESEVEQYNAENGEKSVKKNRFSVKDGEAILRITYSSAKDYAQFNHIGFYNGDIQGAVQAGYAFEGEFLEVTDGKIKEGEPIWGSSIMSGTNYQTLAIEEALLVEVPGTIKYVSSNMKVKDKSTAVLEESETAYILYE